MLVDKRKYFEFKVNIKYPSTDKGNLSIATETFSWINIKKHGINLLQALQMSVYDLLEYLLQPHSVISTLTDYNGNHG